MLRLGGLSTGVHCGQARRRPASSEIGVFWNPGRRFDPHADRPAEILHVQDHGATAGAGDEVSMLAATLANVTAPFSPAGAAL